MMHISVVLRWILFKQMLFVERQKEHPTCEKLNVGMLVVMI